MQLQDVYGTLLKACGRQGWWPAHRNFRPREWEIAAGAVLTQNTNWKNVERALDNLEKEKMMTWTDVLNLPEKRLKEIIKPAGFYNQKAARLKILAGFVSSFGNFENFKKNVKREDLLRLNGIGPETADSILLYACGRPFFVVDAYTRRVFRRLGFLKGDESYEAVRETFERGLPKDAELYKEFHALVVELAKRNCRKKPECGTCPLAKQCKNSRRPRSCHAARRPCAA